MKSEQPRRRCNACTHYYITHETSFPYGCEAMGFKSRSEPSREVRLASGEECRYFSPRRRATVGAGSEVPPSQSGRA